MYGVSAVMTPTLWPTMAPRRSVFAVMPSTQFTRSVRIAWRIQVIDWNSACPITGSNAFSCS